MSYDIFILRRAQKELSGLSDESYKNVKEAIVELSANPRPTKCRKLTARDGFRIRIGNYRVIYDINDSEKTVTILHVGHRSDIYRQS